MEHRHAGHCDGAPGARCLVSAASSPAPAWGPRGARGRGRLWGCSGSAPWALPSHGPCQRFVRAQPLTHPEAPGEQPRLCPNPSVSTSPGRRLSSPPEHRPAASAAATCEREMPPSAQIRGHLTKPVTGVSVILSDLVKNQSKQLHP